MLGRVIGFLAIGVLAAATPAQALRRVYITNIDAASVTVLDAERRTVLGVIPVGQEPDGIAASPDGATVWVANFASDSVSVIETATDTVVATVAVGDGPVGLAVSPDGAEVWVTNRLSGTVTILASATRTPVGEVAVGPASGVNAIAFTPDGTRALVTQSLQDSLSVIDTAQRRVVDGVRIGRVPNRVVVAPRGDRAYVTLFRGNSDDPDVYSQLVAVDLATLAVVGRAQAQEPSGLALSPDARMVFVTMFGRVLRFDAQSLELRGELPLGYALNGILPLDAQTLLAADTTRNLLRPLPAGFGFDVDTPPPLPAPIAVPPGPFALAALPPQADALVAAITAPTYAAKLDRSATTDVRIAVAAGELALAQWTLVLQRADGSQADLPLAAGTDAVQDGVVASLSGVTLSPGAAYVLRLTANAADSSSIVRQLPFTVPDRRYALVPLRGWRDYYEQRVPMDGIGRRFLPSASPYELDLYDSSTGTTDPIRPRLALIDTDRMVLSRNGRRLGLTAEGELVGTFDLETEQFWLVPYRPLRFDIDAEGRWLVGFRLNPAAERYQLFDLIAGERYFISAVAGDDGGGAACDTGAAQQPRISADGSVVAFLTGLNLGQGPSQGCRVFTYDRATQALHLVTELSGHSVAQPSLDDAGARFGIVLRADDAPPNGGSRATLIDLASGGRTDLLGDHPAQSFDAALSGDGRAVFVSSCADLDPSVGNADRNDELFRLDLASGHFAQVTDTQGSVTRCETVRGASYDPLVSTDGQQLSMVLLDATEAGPQRSLRNDLAFGAVRVVPVVEGNTPPKFELEGATTVLAGERLGLSLRSGDRDFDPLAFFAQMGEAGLRDDVYFRVDRNDPQASFSWYPPPEAAGEHTLRLGVFDDRGGEVVRDIVLSVCRLYVDASSPELVAAAIFGALPAACGSADRNGDGALGAADLLAAGSD